MRWMSHMPAVWLWNTAPDRMGVTLMAALWEAKR